MDHSISSAGTSEVVQLSLIDSDNRNSAGLVNTSAVSPSSSSSELVTAVGPPTNNTSSHPSQGSSININDVVIDYRSPPASVVSTGETRNDLTYAPPNYEEDAHRLAAYSLHQIVLREFDRMTSDV